VSFLKALSSAGIHQDQLVDISEQDLIRIEKKLIAEQRLSGTISKNDISQAIQVLKEYPDVMQILVKYTCFWGILTGVDADELDRFMRHTPEELARIKHVIDTYFIDEITTYVVVCCNTDNWNNIGVLMYYRMFLSAHVMQVIAGKLRGKIEYGIALINQTPSADVLDDKLGFLCKAEFYKRLAQVNETYFGNDVKTITSLATKNRENTWTRNFYDEVLNAVNDSGSRRWSTRPYTEPVYSNYESGSGSLGWRAIGSFATLFLLIIRLLSAIGSCSSNHMNSSRDYYNSGGYGDSQYSGGLSALEDIRGDIKEYDSQNDDDLYSKTYTDDEWETDANAQYAGFLIARSNPTSNAEESEHESILHPKKYHNPFALQLFADSKYQEIKKSAEKVKIFNETNEDCVVLAFYKTKEIQKNGYYRHKLYALYLPANDNIQIDLGMAALRFYVGKGLAKFSAGSGYTYPDAEDAKFKNYSKAAAFLFHKEFYVYKKDGDATKVHNVWLSQPDRGSYELKWDNHTKFAANGVSAIQVGEESKEGRQDSGTMIIFPTTSDNFNFGKSAVKFW
jgi:hypothetical protein